MASESSTVEEVSETPDGIRELKLGIVKEWLKVVYIVSTFISINVIPGLLFGTVVVLETVVTNVPNLTLQPLAIHAASSDGVAVTKLIKSFVVLDVIRNLLTLYWKGQPNIQLDPNFRRQTMTKHDVYWPEMGIENDGDADVSDDAVKEWTEHPTLRKVLLTIYLGTEVIRIASFGTIAGVLLLGTVRAGIGLYSSTAILWSFIAVVAVVMAIDELAKQLINYSIQYGAFLVATVLVVSLLQLYLGLKQRRNSIDDPSALASSLPIESIPLLELYERRNRLM